MTEDEISQLALMFKKHHKAFSGFMNNVQDFFSHDNDALLDDKAHSVVHSIKSRFKDIEHIKDKIRRKDRNHVVITADNIFNEVADYCGVRVMHLKRTDFSKIHAAIMSHVGQQHWYLAEDPKSYTWDPEYKAYFETLEIRSEIKESFYTSVHYLVKPNEETKVVCEIQVRSLFEEIWGEVDHDLNYPNPSTSLACKEQLKILAKLVGAGSRLVDSIYNSLDADAKGGV